MQPTSENLPDPHFGTDEQMLAWAERVGITPRKDSRGAWDWQAAWDEYLARPDESEPEP